MATQVQNRRGSTAEHSTFTGAVGEVTIDTDKDTAVVHDGSTAGGRPLLREDLSNLPAGTIDNADINASAAIAGTKISPNFGSQNVTTTGTSTAASFIPTSSTAPTNGVYLSAANSVALSTNGTGRLLIDSSGNLIQYSTTTLERQHRQQASSAYTATNIKSVLDGAAGYLTFDTGTNWTNGNAVERLRITSTGQLSHIGAGSVGSPAVSFSGSANSDSLVVASSSRVGVGTSSPGTLLTVQNDTNDGPTISSQFVSAGYNSQLRFKTYSSNLNASNNVHHRIVHRFDTNEANGYIDFFRGDGLANGFLGFGTNGEERLRITSTGLVGIGTSSPGYALDTVASSGSAVAARFRGNGGANNNTQIRFYGNNAATDQWAIGGSIATSDTGRDFHIYDLVANANRFAIDSSGRVGIGATTVSNAMLQVTSAVAGAAIKSEDTGGTGSFLRILGDATSQNLINWKTGTSLRFATSEDNYGTFSERFRCDSSGRLLVGTSSSQDKFFNTSGNGHLVQLESSTITLQSATAHGGTNVGAGAHFTFARSRGTAAGSVTPVVSGDNLARLSFQGADGTEFTEAAAITCNVDTGTVSGSSMPGRLVFSTTADGAASPTERMRIKENGNILINTTTEGAGIGFSTKLAIEGTDVAVFKNSAGSSANLIYAWNAGISGNNAFFGFGTEGTYTARGSINYNRTGGVVAYNTTSDYRAKTLIGEIENPGETIDALKVYRGLMNGATVERPMLVAHEAQEVAPYCVTGEKDAVDDDGNPIYQQMDHQVLVPLLIAEIQQLRARVAALEAQ